MILQALCNYYERKADELPQFGFQEKEIPFTIVLDMDGHFIQLEDNRSLKSKNIRSFRVPKGPGRVGKKAYETAYWLWDHYGYVLEQPKMEKPDTPFTPKAIDDAKKQHASFKREVDRIAQELPDDRGVQAVQKFLDSEEEIKKVKAHDNWAECLKIKGCNLTFQLANQKELICQSPAVIKWVKSQPLAKDDIRKGICLITGELSEDIVRLHDAVSGVTQKPNPLAAVKENAYKSYGKTQGFNFPVSAQEAFKYATALNHLLRNNFKLADTTYTCWSDKQMPLESLLPIMVSGDPDQMTEAVKSLFKSIHNGAYTKDDGQQKFFLLGMSPNVARIVVRYWKAGTVAEFSQHIAQWFEDLKIIKSRPEDDEYPIFKRLLRSTVLQGKDDNIPSSLSADVLRSILNGARLPEQFFQAVIRRIKAEQGKVSYHRACIIKANLNRKYRLSNSKPKEVNMSLDKHETRIGYCLGRLFAVLEKLQSDTHPGINSTIRDRYYSSASSTPKAVFGTLMRLKNHHMKKLQKPEWQVSTEKRIGEIMEHIREFPSHLNLENQGLFAIGYYHQKQDLYTKKSNPNEEKRNESK